MQVLIVHAHPEPRSFCSAMARLAAATLAEAGHAVVVSDLYAMRFDPVAKAADFRARSDPDYLVYALEQRHAHETGTLAPDIVAEVEKLVACDLLLLSFPLFWFSVPAILKGWIDRVLLSGLTYGGRRFYDRGPLRGKRGTLALTLGARPHMFGPGAIHGELLTMLKPLLQGTLGYTGMAVLPPFCAYHVPYLDDGARQAILADYRQYLLTLDARPPLTLPSLADYDPQMRPK